jgi:hypothetical protein
MRMLSHTPLLAQVDGYRGVVTLEDVSYALPSHRLGDEIMRADLMLDDIAEIELKPSGHRYETLRQMPNPEGTR